MALGPDGKPYKTRADVHMAGESPARAFARRREALTLKKEILKGGGRKQEAGPSLLAELAPNIPVTSLEKTNKLAWILTYLAHRFGPREKLRSYAGTGQSGIHRMADTGTVALYGDWASGTLAAAQVATRIREHSPEHTIHMGDIYFVGDEDEARENFLGEEVAGSPWQAVAFPRGSQRSFALNGNHEMYARGRGYFRRVLPALDQQASFFALENEHWRIIGLDSGYHSITWPFRELLFRPDCHLPDAVVDWLKEIVTTPRREDMGSGDAKDPRGTIILTHHQPFSFYEPGFPRLMEQIGAVLGGPVLWFWGHEHWMSVYAPVERAGLEIHGRCIGHGGMPCEPPGTKRDPSYPILLEDHRILDTGAQVVLWPNGYAMLGFDGPDLRVDYRDVAGTLVAHEAWTVRDGTIVMAEAPVADVEGVGPPL
ncbi:metallophosphoesterase family protein [Novosphingobium terrae]|uniref:metallophosphoesterase family protein n=1 Tax=Novosphingobium terrae TaxID=2726189 RepID=UPI00198124D3|nr:metallophosphoesterase [Novosphingobium terrae]